jgi:hypothetical protein
VVTTGKQGFFFVEERQKQGLFAFDNPGWSPRKKNPGGHSQ